MNVRTYAGGQRALPAPGGGDGGGDRRGPDEVYGERVHAVVVPAAGRRVTLEELRGFCTDRIAGYKPPRSMEAVGALPISAAGTVLERELRKPSWAAQERGVH